MICIPKYNVSYKGEFYKAGERIKIDVADRKEMEKHGNILEETASAKENVPVEETTVMFTPPAKRSGRPRKAVSA